MFKTDCHLHTTFSPDGKQTPEELLKAAVTAGLSEFTVTDHCECNAWYGREHYSAEEQKLRDSFDYAADFENSVTAVTALKEKYAGKLELICGVELGQILQDKTAAEKLEHLHNLDGEPLAPTRVEVLRSGRETAELQFIIHEGKNRQIRRMCAEVGLHVKRLRRVKEHYQTLGDLPSGQWRDLTESELSAFDRD